jgi:hypothetical protein
MSFLVPFVVAGIIVVLFWWMNKIQQKKGMEQQKVLRQQQEEEKDHHRVSRTAEQQEKPVQPHHNGNVMLRYEQEHNRVNTSMAVRVHNRVIPVIPATSLHIDNRMNPPKPLRVNNGYAVGSGHGLSTFQQQGPNRKPRKCKLCQQSPNPQRIAFSEWCSGRGGARFCSWGKNNLSK